MKYWPSGVNDVVIRLSVLELLVKCSIIRIRMPPLFTNVLLDFGISTSIVQAATSIDFGNGINALEQPITLPFGFCFTISDLILLHAKSIKYASVPFASGFSSWVKEFTAIAKKISLVLLYDPFLMPFSRCWCERSFSWTKKKKKSTSWF